jgi:hypothetical protein
MKLNDIKQQLDEMPPEDALKLIIDIRNNRRKPKEAPKAARQRKNAMEKALDKLSLDDINKVLEALDGATQ